MKRSRDAGLELGVKRLKGEGKGEKPKPKPKPKKEKKEKKKEVLLKIQTVAPRRFNVNDESERKEGLEHLRTHGYAAWTGVVPEEVCTTAVPQPFFN